MDLWREGENQEADLAAVFRGSIRAEGAFFFREAALTAGCFAFVAFLTLADRVRLTPARFLLFFLLEDVTRALLFFLSPTPEDASDFAEAAFCFSFL